MYGFIDGAVRAGERPATEVMEREAMTVASSAERRPLRPVHLGPYRCAAGVNTLNIAPCGSIRTADRPTVGMSNGSTAT